MVCDVFNAALKIIFFDKENIWNKPFYDSFQF